MNKIEEILKDKGITSTTKYHNYEYLYKVIQESMIEFGKLAFEAGREHTWHFIDEYSGFEKNKYSTYEDFLKKI